MVERLAATRVPPLPFAEVYPAYNLKQEVFRKRIEESPVFLASTLDMIAEVARTHKLAVVSSSGRTEVEPPIQRAGIHHHFQTMVCGREAERLKPAPDPYLRAAALIGAKRPLVVEDSEAGETAGRAAGFDVLRVPSATSVAEEVLRYLSK